MTNNLDAELDEILQRLHYGEVLTFNKDGTTTSVFNWDKFKSALKDLIAKERADELLSADDEVRLHNKIEGSYQSWFTKRLAQLNSKKTRSDT